MLREPSEGIGGSRAERRGEHNARYPCRIASFLCLGLVPIALVAGESLFGDLPAAQPFVLALPDTPSAGVSGAVLLVFPLLSLVFTYAAIVRREPGVLATVLNAAISVPFLTVGLALLLGLDGGELLLLLLFVVSAAGLILWNAHEKYGGR